MRSNSATYSRVDVRTQLRLLRKAERSGEPFSDLLASAGWSYNDLCYTKSRKQTWNGRRPPSLDDLRLPGCHAQVVSFFTGCGGMDLGLEAAGFEHAAAFEINEVFCKTLRRNRPQWKVFGPPTHSGDVSKFDEISAVLASVVGAPFGGLFVDGPPCQPFSIAANQRFAKSGENFKRIGFSHGENGNLLFDFVRLIAAFRPRAFVIENVPGLRDLDGGAQLRRTIDELRTIGYNVEEPFCLDAAHYYVPQQRFRLFVVGSRSEGRFRGPAPSIGTYGSWSVLRR